MESEYDLVVLGTGLTEMIIAALMSMKGKKVLIIDQNKYYGGKIASLNLKQMFELFKDTTPPTELGPINDYSIDLIPKLIMSNGKFAKIVRATGITRIGIELESIGGSFVYQDGTFHKVPVGAGQVINSPLLGSEPIKTRQLLNFLNNYNQNEPKTHQGLDCSKLTIEEIFQHFGVCQQTRDFLGHVVAMYSDSDFNRPSLEFIERVSLYEDSLNEHGKSPFIYPKFGFGELTQAFTRLSALNGSTFMLDTPVDRVHYDENGHVCGVESDGKIAKCQTVIGDSSYFPDKVHKIEKVIHVICILSHHPVANISNSSLLLFPKPHNHKHDIYCHVLNNHMIAPQGKFIVIVSTIVETEYPENEIEEVINLIGPIDERFVSIREIHQLIDETGGNKLQEHGVFVTKSYDSTIHLESCATDIEDIYERMCGEKLNFTRPISSFLTAFHQDEEEQ